MFKKLTLYFLSFVTTLSVCACSNSAPSSKTISFPDGISEKIESEDVRYEDVSYEAVSSEALVKQETLGEIVNEEIYLEELVVAEEEITEQLIQDSKIEEVVSSDVYYICQDNIQEFAENSRTADLFGEDFDVGPLLTKVAIGTGVIITLTVLKIVNLDGLAGSIIAAAAPAALQGAAVGTGVGTLIGGLTGATDEIDETGRTSAIVGFSIAVAGLITAIINLAVAIPSGGASSVGAAVGIKLAIAGIELALAVAGASYSAYNMVKTLQVTDQKEIDWGDIDWDKVGVSAARESINGAANGYMWGSVLGAVSGGAEGLASYERTKCPYSSYENRIKQTPTNEGSNGHWTGKPGESTFVRDEPITCENGVVVKEVTYKNGVPDFSPYSEAEVNITGMTDNRYLNFKKADELCAKYFTKIKYKGQTWSARDVANYRTNYGLAWHEMNNMKTMQLVPSKVNLLWGHLGGVGEYKEMIRQKGVLFTYA